MAKAIQSWERVQLRVPYTRTHITRLEKAGLFPRRVRLGAGRVGWVEEEIDAWIESRIAERDGQE
jgi:prophage regulatory protein|nr:AlpA family phage regulatory protein [Yoonia sp.]